MDSLWGSRAHQGIYSLETVYIWVGCPWAGDRALALAQLLIEKEDGVQELVLMWETYSSFKQGLLHRHLETSTTGRYMSLMFCQFMVTYHLMISLPGGRGWGQQFPEVYQCHVHAVFCLQAQEGFGHCSSRWPAGSGLELPGVTRFQVPREKAF